MCIVTPQRNPIHNLMWAYCSNYSSSIVFAIRVVEGESLATFSILPAKVEIPPFGSGLILLSTMRNIVASQYCNDRIQPDLNPINYMDL